MVCAVKCLFGEKERRIFRNLLGQRCKVEDGVPAFFSGDLRIPTFAYPPDAIQVATLASASTHRNHPQPWYEHQSIQHRGEITQFVHPAPTSMSFTPEHGEASSSRTSPGLTGSPPSGRRGKLSAHERQAQAISKLLAHPDKEIRIPDGPKEKSIRPARDVMKNVTGSSAGAGSGEFHVYKQQRRREYERIQLMEEQNKKVRCVQSATRNTWNKSTPRTEIPTLTLTLTLLCSTLFLSPTADRAGRV